MKEKIEDINFNLTQKMIKTLIVNVQKKNYLN